MKILIVAATAQEINKDDFINHDVLITGIGMVNTVFSLTKYLHNHTPDLIINAGVAGAYNLDFKIGDVVEVSKDCFSEIGSQSGDDFLDVNGSRIVEIESKDMVSNYMWRFRRSDAFLRNEWINYTNWAYKDVIPKTLESFRNNPSLPNPADFFITGNIVNSDNTEYPVNLKNILIGDLLLL